MGTFHRSGIRQPICIRKDRLHRAVDGQEANEHQRMADRQRQQQPHRHVVLAQLERLAQRVADNLPEIDGNLSSEYFCATHCIPTHPISIGNFT